MNVISVYVVFASASEAEAISRAAVEERLAACVNLLGPVKSIYRWEGAIEAANEVAAIFKTSHGALDALMTRISELHSYDVPCIAAWPLERINADYERFVIDNVG